MSNRNPIPDGFILKMRADRTSEHSSHRIDEKQFQDWQRRWNSKEEVIDHLLDELEKTMAASESVASSE